MKILSLSSLFLLFLSAIVVAQTKQCDYGPTPCEAYASAEAVFVGEVIKIVPLTTKIWQKEDEYDQTAYVRIEKAYKGIKERDIVLRQLGRRHAQKFILGSHYLFYANYDRAAKIWEVKPCGRTRMAKYVQDDLHYLNGLPAVAKRSRIAGEIVRYDTDDENPQGITERLSGIKLKVVGNGREYEAVTDANGIYEIYDALPGRYTVYPRIPNGLVFLLAIHYGPSAISKAKTLEFELKEDGCVGLDIVVTADKSLRKEAKPKISRLHRLQENRVNLSNIQRKNSI